MHGTLEVEDVEARWRLIEAIAITALVDPEQAAQHQSDRGLVRDDENGLTLVGCDDLTDRRQRARQHRYA